MIRNVVLTVLSLIFTLNSTFCQLNEKKRANVWNFGYQAGLDFSTCSPVGTTTSQLNSFEGSASISDLNGNLLMYSSGDTIWDASNNVMLNGTGLLGSESSVQSAIFVPKHGDPDWYYMFTAGSSLEDSGAVGIRYSEIDLTLNGGLGGVVPLTKNTLLFLPNEEKLTAVRNAAGDGYWVIAQEKSTNIWHAYEVTSSGVNTTPVTSIMGPSAKPNNSLGAKFSPDGTMLVTQNECALGNAALTLYDFDNATGILTYRWFDCGVAGFKLEFSPNSSKLYVSGTFLFQYDLTAGGGTGIGVDTVPVKASLTQISTAAWEIDQLQLAPDCKIYVGSAGSPPFSTDAIGVIQNPNLAGVACGYTANIMSVVSGSLGHRFPNFITSFFEFPCNDAFFTFQNTCVADTVQFDVQYCNTVDSVQWDFNDPTGSPGNSSTSFTPTHIFSASGSYNVQMISYVLGVADTVINSVVIQNCGSMMVIVSNDTTICESTCATISALTSGGSGTSTYYWLPSIGTGTGPFTVCPTVTTDYIVLATDSLGLTATDTITVTVNPTFDATISTVASICTNASTIVLQAVDTSGIWSGTGITNTTTGVFDPSVAGAGIHTIIYTISGICGDADTVTINVTQAEDATITSSTEYCIDQTSISLTATNSGGLWSGTGITNTTTGVFDPITAGVGTHTIIYTISGICGDADTATITVNQLADATITAIGPYCSNVASVTLQATDPLGVWSGTGIIDAVAGVFDPSTAGAGTHTIIYTISGGCTDADTTTIVVNQSADATISSVGVMCSNESVITLVGAESGGIWSGAGIIDSVSGDFDPAVAGIGTAVITYVIVASCGDSDVLTILVEDCTPLSTHIYIPNIFSPNGDAQNDVLFVRGSGIQEFIFAVFNRWGEKVFETTDQTIGWDGSYKGKPMNTGVFAYYISGTYLDGKNFSQKGSITLLK